LRRAGEKAKRRKKNAVGIANETGGEKKERGTRFVEVGKNDEARFLTGDAANQSTQITRKPASRTGKRSGK
jgi:hypothetical protein